MGFLYRIKAALSSFMSGRNGVDNLGYSALWTGLVVSLAGTVLGVGIFSTLGMALYIYSLWRMLSRNCYKRAAENNAYVQWRYGFTTKAKQFIMRLKNSKEFKYVRCSQCRTLIRLKRGVGERSVRCPKCRNEFTARS